MPDQPEPAAAPATRLVHEGQHANSQQNVEPGAGQRTPSAQALHEQDHASAAGRSGSDPNLDKVVKQLDAGEQAFKQQLESAPEPAKPAVRTNEEARALARELAQSKSPARDTRGIGGH